MFSYRPYKQDKKLNKIIVGKKIQSYKISIGMITGMIDYGILLCTADVLPISIIVVFRIFWVLLLGLNLCVKISVEVLPLSLIFVFIVNLEKLLSD